MTAGIVFVYGAVKADPSGGDNPEEIQKQAKAIEKALSVIMNLLTGGD